MSVELAREAVAHIAATCPRIGGVYSVDGSAFRFVHAAAETMGLAPNTNLFGSRHKEHVAYAMSLVAKHFGLEPPLALASLFLATRLELYFRVLSRHLKADGRWISQEARSEAASLLSDGGLKKKAVVSNIAVAYKIMMLNTASPVVAVFGELEGQLRPTYPPAEYSNHEFWYDDVGSRVACMRHPTAHGFYSDASSEGLFYALVTSIIYYAHDQA